MSYVRVFSFVGVFTTALFLPIWVFLPVAVVYMFAFPGYEILIVALLIDAQFGDRSGDLWYRYTVVSAVLLLITTSIKPYLMFYR